MDIADAFTLVLELARGNIVESNGHDEMANEMKRQLEACDMVEDFIVNQLGDK